MKQLISSKNKKIGYITTKFLSIFFHTKKKQDPIQFGELRKIIIVDFPMIGDLVVGIPFYKILRKNCPNAHITLICQKWASKIMSAQGVIDEFIEFDGKKILHDPLNLIRNYIEFKKTLRNVNKNEYDIAIEPRGDIRNIFFMRHIHSNEYISFNYSGGECMLSRVIIPDESIVHILDDKLNILEQLGLKINKDDRIPELIIPQKYMNDAEMFLSKIGIKSEDKILAINPGASTDLKKWRNFPELINKIELAQHVVILVFGVIEDEIVIDEILRVALKKNIRAFKVIVNLPLYISLLSKCNCMICNDSSAQHLAAAFNIPVVTIFSIYEPEFGMPRSRNKVIALSKKFDCKPCFSHVCKYNHRCINSISVDDVLNAFYSVWNK